MPSVVPNKTAPADSHRMRACGGVAMPSEGPLEVPWECPRDVLLVAGWDENYMCNDRCLFFWGVSAFPRMRCLYT